MIFLNMRHLQLALFKGNRRLYIIEPPLLFSSSKWEVNLGEMFFTVSSPHILFLSYTPSQDSPVF